MVKWKISDYTSNGHEPGNGEMEGYSIYDEDEVREYSTGEVVFVPCDKDDMNVVHLIAAAPEMLEALKAVQKYDVRIQSHAFKGKNYVEDSMLDDLYEDFISKTNEAVAKAEGKRTA